MPPNPSRQAPFALFAAELLLAAALIFAPVAGSRAQETAAQAMAHAIARMMETMGFTGAMGSAPPVGAWPPVDPGTMGMDAWPPALGVAPGAQSPGVRPSVPPGGTLADSLRQAMPMMEGGAGSGATAWSNSPLEGLWEDNQGGLLIVQGASYRLYASCKGYIEGNIQIGGERLELSNRQEGFSQTFEFALDQGRLALRDQSGQVYLYRRLVLNQMTGR